MEANADIRRRHEYQQAPRSRRISVRVTYRQSGTAKCDRGKAVGAERDRVAGFGRLEDGLRQPGSEWYRWGPYVSERQWGTVREDYSADGDAWDYLPHDHARSRAYRWGEDGLAGFCDIEQRLCLGLALWNGRDPILKERIVRADRAEGNHGEDVKEYWWYLDAVPSHAWNRWRYHYPQGAFPYEDLLDRERAPEPVRARVRAARHRRLRRGPLLDRRGPLRQGRPRRPADGDRGHQRRAGAPRRSTCCPPPGSATPGPGTSTSRQAGAGAPTGDRRSRIDHPFLGELELIGRPWPRREPTPTLLFCENETNRPGSTARTPATPYPEGRHQRPRGRRARPRSTRPRPGTKGAFWYQVERRGRARRPSCGCGCGRRNGRRQAAPGRGRARRRTSTR